MSKKEIVQININTSHYNPNTDRYRMNLGQAVDFSKCNMSLIKTNCYNSTFNIKSSYDNNRIGIKWIDNQIYQWTIEDGTYSLGDLNAYLESKMFEAGLYVNITATGKPNYFVKIQENPVLYACHVIVSYVPTATESQTLGYEKPDGSTWSFPSVSVTPQLLLISQGMLTFLGFNELVLPPAPVQNDNYEKVSSKAPRLSPIFNYTICCNLLNNRLGMAGANQQFCQISVDKGIGQLIQFEPNFKTELPCVSKTDFIELWLTDERFNKLDYRDKDFSCSFILEFYE